MWLGIGFTERPGSAISAKGYNQVRIAVITLNGSRYGRSLLRVLGVEVHRADLVVVVQDTLERKWRLLRSVARRIGWWDACLYAVEELATRALVSRNDAERGTCYDALAAKVAHVESARSSRVPRLLAEHQVDLVLLGQSGIIPREVLEVPRIGTLNAHPGVLPAYRGVDCAGWAILQDEYHMVGSTVHWVDAGVDTGPILRRLPYAWVGDETLRTLTERLYADCIRWLVDAVKSVCEDEFASEPNEGGKQYYKMPRALRRQTARKLERFLMQQTLKSVRPGGVSSHFTGQDRTDGSHWSAS